MRRSIRKTLKFKGKQFYAVFENFSHNKNRKGYAVSRRISGNYSKKSQAEKFLLKTSKRR